MGYIKIENTIAVQENYDDIAASQGWTGKKLSLTEQGRPEIGEDGNPVFTDQSSQEFIAERFREFSDGMNRQACMYQEAQQGKLNYDAAAMIAAFKATTNVEWIDE